MHDDALPGRTGFREKALETVRKGSRVTFGALILLSFGSKTGLLRSVSPTFEAFSSEYIGFSDSFSRQFGE